MTKNEAYKHFTEYYPKLTDSDKEAFSRLALRLLGETFLVKDRDEDRKDYLKCSEMFDTLRPHFAFMDYDLNIDREKGVIFIRTVKDSNRIRFKKMETITLLVLRYIYDEESQKASINSTISTTVGHLSAEISRTEIYPNFGGRDREFRDALKNLKRYKIINFEGDESLGTTPIVIYRSILLLVDVTSIDDLNARLSQYKGGSLDEDNQETEAD